MDPNPRELLEVAVHAARDAGALLVERLNHVRTIEHKDTGRTNLVTDADYASEKLILAELASRFPSHAIVAEESGAQGQSPYTWFVDPLDGTTNYAHGIPHFCVTLAVEGPTPEGTRLLAGVVYDPTREELFAAARGQGATLNGKPIRVSQPPSLDASVLCTGFPYDIRLRPEAPLGLFMRLIRQAQGMRRMGSAALDLAWVAAGRFDGFFEFSLKPWDTAAGALLIQEAGGSIFRIDGEPYDVRFGDIVASSGPVMEQLRAECRAFVHDIGWHTQRFA